MRAGVSRESGQDAVPTQPSHIPHPASLIPLMKVPRRVDQLLHLELTEFPADHIPHPIVALELSFHHYESRESHHVGIFLDHFLGDDHVDEAVLVFHQQKHSTLRALGLLTDRDQTGGGDPLSTLELLQLLRVENTRVAKFLAQMLHRVAADADAYREIVEEDQLVPCKRLRFVRYMTRWRSEERG